MTREKAIQVNQLLYKIECYEAVLEELSGMPTIEELYTAYGENLMDEFSAIIQPKLNAALKELEDL